MGSQQILLYAFSILLVVITLITGYLFIINYIMESNRNQLLDNIFKVYQTAMEYRKKTTSLGGGGGSFEGWSIPPSLKSTKSGNITYLIGKDYLVLHGEGNVKGRDSESNISVWVRFSDRNGRTIRFNN